MDQRSNYQYIPGDGPGVERQASSRQQFEREIDLIEIMRLLLHKAWLIVLAAVICALAVGLGMKKFVTPTYKARATISVISTSGDTSSQTLNLTKQMTPDFQILATARPTVNLVIEELGWDTTVEKVMAENQISVWNPSNSHMLRIEVTNRDPAAAAELSNALAKVMCDQIAYIMDSEIPQVVEPAVLGEKSGPSVKRNAMIGGLGAAALVVAVLLLRYFLNDTVTTEEDVKRYLGLTVLTAIPAERKRTKG